MVVAGMAGKVDSWVGEEEWRAVEMTYLPI